MQTNVSSAKKFFYDNWLTLLIALQPLLDTLAFWTQNERGTVAGVIRLIIMLVLPIVLLIKLKGKQRLRLFLALAAVGVICANDPVCVKQSSTRRPFASRATARRLYFWSRKKPVFCPFSKSTRVAYAVFA